MWAQTCSQALGKLKEIFPPAFSLDDLPPANASLAVSGAAVEIVTPPNQWAVGAKLPINPGVRVTQGRPLLVRIEGEVKSGRVGIGGVAEDGQTYVSPEVERSEKDGTSTFYVPLDPIDGRTCKWIVVRNTATSGLPSRVILRSLRAFAPDRDHLPDLVEIAPERVSATTMWHNGDPDARAKFFPIRDAATRRAGTTNDVRFFKVALTHTSRDWDWARSSRDYLTQRYHDPERLRSVPTFTQLQPHPHDLYHGGLTFLRLEVSSDSVRATPTRCIDSRSKIQHVCRVGRNLVLCFEFFLAMMSQPDELLAGVRLGPGSRRRIDDNWFGGLHTVYPVDDETCLVSSSAADAVLWLDLPTRKVIRRWRLPAKRYGVNYELNPSMSVVNHYVHNDLQLAHLNSAYPDGSGGCYLSTLSGDIGHVGAHGEYSLLAEGYVGCHGVRYSRNGDGLYFTDSCGGRLMRISPENNVSELYAVDSTWLHDVVQLDGDLYLFCLGDKNEVAIIDIGRRELGRFSMGERGVNVQFASVL